MEIFGRIQRGFIYLPWLLNLSRIKNEVKDFSDEIKNVIKFVEGRVPKSSKDDPSKPSPETDYSRINIDDIAQFSAYDRKYIDPVFYSITKIVHFQEENARKSVEMMIYSLESHTYCSPSCETKKDAIDEYLSFKGYPKRIEKFGIYAVHIFSFINLNKNIYK